MITSIKEVAQVISLLFGILLLGNVLFHLALYLGTGTDLSEVNWLIHALTASIGAALLYLGMKNFKLGLY